MKEELLNQEAIIYSANIKASYPEDVDDNTLEYECHKAFLKGARWHELLPLVERLSDSEIENLKAIYWRKTIPSMPDINAKYVEQALLEAIFGKDLFTKSE